MPSWVYEHYKEQFKRGVEEGKKLREKHKLKAKQYFSKVYSLLNVVMILISFSLLVFVFTYFPNPILVLGLTFLTILCFVNIVRLVSKGGKNEKV